MQLEKRSTRGKKKKNLLVSLFKFREMASTDTKNPITITIITTAQTKLFASYQVMSATLSEYTSCFFWLCVFFLLQTQGNSVGDSFCFSH